MSRYCWGGTPLWQSKDGIPQDSAFAKCERCGAQRIYEMQVSSIDALCEDLECSYSEDLWDDADKFVIICGLVR